MGGERLLRWEALLWIRMRMLSIGRQRHPRHWLWLGRDKRQILATDRGGAACHQGTTRRRRVRRIRHEIGARRGSKETPVKLKWWEGGAGSVKLSVQLTDFDCMSLTGKNRPYSSCDALPGKVTVPLGGPCLGCGTRLYGEDRWEVMGCSLSPR